MKDAPHFSQETAVNRLRDMEVGWEDASGLIDLLKGLRHTTEFEPRVIPREYVNQILAAGRWSSSLYNSQPWYFVVVAGRPAHKILQDMVWAARMKLRRLRPFLSLAMKFLRDPQFKASLKKAKAPQQVIFDHTVAIVSCIDASKPEAAASTAMALNNMALEATRLGMGCAFTSSTQSLNLLKQAGKEFGVPEGYRFFVGLMVGFPKRGLEVSKGQRREIAEISHWV